MSVELALRDVVIATLRIDRSAYRDNLKVGDVEEWDSVAQLDLIMAIEAAFHVHFSPEQMTELTSIELLLQFLGAGRRE